MYYLDLFCVFSSTSKWALFATGPEFYSSIDINDPELGNKLSQWEAYYNTQRPHSSLQGKTPFEKYKSLEKQALSQAEIDLAYEQTKEKIAVQNYKYDQILRV